MEKFIIQQRIGEKLKITAYDKTIVIPYFMRAEAERMLTLKCDKQLMYEKMNFLKDKAKMLEKVRIRELV